MGPTYETKNIVKAAVWMMCAALIAHTLAVSLIVHDIIGANPQLGPQMPTGARARTVMISIPSLIFFGFLTYEIARGKCWARSTFLISACIMFVAGVAFAAGTFVAQRRGSPTAIVVAVLLCGMGGLLTFLIYKIVWGKGWTRIIFLLIVVAAISSGVASDNWTVYRIMDMISGIFYWLSFVILLSPSVKLWFHETSPAAKAGSRRKGIEDPEPERG